MADKVSLQSGKASKSINYHNSRDNMDKKTEEFSHIDKEKTKNNINWHLEGNSNAECYDQYYSREFAPYIEGRKKKNKNYDAQQMIKSHKTSPHEDIWQIGNCLDGVSKRERAKQLLSIFNEYVTWQEETFLQTKVLSIDLHMDEKSPHIHVQTVFWAVDENGNKYVHQNDAMEQMGYDLPKDGEKGRHNNRISIFTKMCREKFIEIAKEHGLEIDENVRDWEHVDKMTAALRQTEAKLAEKERELADKDKKLADKDKELADKEKALEQIENQSDYDKGFEDAKALFEKAVADGVYVDGDKYNKVNKDLSAMTQLYNEKNRLLGEAEAELDNIKGIERD